MCNPGHIKYDVLLVAELCFSTMLINCWSWAGAAEAAAIFAVVGISLPHCLLWMTVINYRKVCYYDID